MPKHTETSHRVAHITTIDMSLRYLLLNQLISIQQDGYEVVGISTPGPNVEALELNGIRHIPVKMTRSISPMQDLISLWQLYQLMRRERFTIVHTHTPKPGLIGQLAARLARVPIIVNTVHGFYFHENMTPLKRHFYILMEKIAARCSDIILSQNSEDINTAVREKICSPDKIKFLGNGIDITRFCRERLDVEVQAKKRAEIGLHDGPVVGFVGRLVVEKGIIELLEAMQIVKMRIPNVQLLIVGPIDKEKHDVLTPNIAGQYGLAESTFFTGMRQDMPEMYGLMDVFVLPSHREGFPRSPMEAAAMEVPCVVTDIRGCRETVKHRENGLLVQLGDVQSLAESIVRILTQEGLSQQMGCCGRQLAKERFDEHLVFKHIKAEYKRMLEAKGLRAPLAPHHEVLN